VALSPTHPPTPRLLPPTKESGQGRSNTVPRQFEEKISDTVRQVLVDAHHAQLSFPAHEVQLSENWLHDGRTASNRTNDITVHRFQVERNENADERKYAR
jgi:hypothetical protein